MENILKKQLKNFLWGKVGKYQIFFVTLQRISEKRDIYKDDNIDNLRGNQKHPKKSRTFSGTPHYLPRYEDKTTNNIKQ